MPALLPQPHPQGLLEYVMKDLVMKDLSRILKRIYNAQAVIVVHGSGTFGMKAIARQIRTPGEALNART